MRASPVLRCETVERRLIHLRPRKKAIPGTPFSCSWPPPKPSSRPSLSFAIPAGIYEVQEGDTGFPSGLRVAVHKSRAVRGVCCFLINVYSNVSSLCPVYEKGNCYTVGILLFLQFQGGGEVLFT